MEESEAEKFCRIVGEECVKRGYMLNVSVTGPELLQFVLDGFNSLDKHRQPAEDMGPDGDGDAWG